MTTTPLQSTQKRNYAIIGDQTGEYQGKDHPYVQENVSLIFFHENPVIDQEDHAQDYQRENKHIEYLG